MTSTTPANDLEPKKDAQKKDEKKETKDAKAGAVKKDAKNELGN